MHNELDAILHTLEEVEEKVSDKLEILFRVIKHDKIPLGLKTLLSEPFQCKICVRPVTVPAMVATCCGQLIGCQSCTDTWYTTGADIMKKTCPACRAERGAARLCQLRGMDSLIKTAKEVLQDPEPTPDDSEAVLDHASNLINSADLPQVNI